MDPDDPRRCTAKSKQSGERCKRPSTPGATVCYYHGGAGVHVEQVAERRLEEDKARRAAATYGLPREVEPHTALLEELHRTAGIVAWLGDLIGRLEHEEAFAPSVMGPPADDEDEDGERPRNARSGLKQYSREKGGFVWEKPSVWVEIYQQERKHLTDVAKVCIAAGIEERRVKLAESQGQLLAQVIRGVLGELGVLDRPEVPAVVRKHLELVAPGQAA